MKMFTPGSGNKFLFVTSGGRLLEVGDYSNKYGMLIHYQIITSS